MFGSREEGKKTGRNTPPVTNRYVQLPSVNKSVLPICRLYHCGISSSPVLNKIGMLGSRAFTKLPVLTNRYVQLPSVNKSVLPICCLYRR